MSDGGNEYHLVLDNSDQSFSVMIQALPMEQAAATFSSLDEIIAFYQQSTLSEYGEPTSSEVVIGDPAIEGVVSDFYEVTQNNMTADLLISYFQTENAYYVCILTGTKAAYDANVDAVKNALTSFTEKAQERKVPTFFILDKKRSFLRSPHLILEHMNPCFFTAALICIRAAIFLHPAACSGINWYIPSERRLGRTTLLPDQIC